MKRKNIIIEQQISSAKPKGLPAPADLANRISAAGMSGDEVLSWLGSVLSRVSMGAAVPEAVEVETSETVVEEPSPERVQEQLEDALLKNLLTDINRSTRKR